MARARRKPPTDKALKDREVCGLVMPISAIDGCSERHWLDVRTILREAAEDAGYRGELVSESTDTGMIHRRIVQNLYHCPIAICDVSAMNPNVMFELGLRIAFNKPVVVVKDNATKYSFDTSGIDHLGYPRDLRHYDILEFQNRLTERIEQTVAAGEDGTFMRVFGPFQVAVPETETVPVDQLRFDRIEEALDSIMREMKQRSARNSTSSGPPDPESEFTPVNPNMLRVLEAYMFDVGRHYPVDESELDTFLHEFQRWAGKRRQAWGISSFNSLAEHLRRGFPKP